MGGGKGDTKQEVTVRYAPYLEDYHQAFLATVDSAVASAMAANPYTAYTDLEIDCAFFGSGYVLCSFPSLYDMYGKFMAGLDIEVLHDEIHQDVINGPVVNETISQEALRLENELEDEVYPRFDTGMRDINSVISSSYIVGRAMLENKRIEALEKFAADARYRLLPIVTERWSGHLSWNKNVIDMYAQILKLYISAKMDVDNQNTEMGAKAGMWPFNPIQYQTAAIGAVSGATNTTSDAIGGSKVARVIGSTMTGAASGAMVGAQIGSVGGPMGAAIGGLVGLASGLF